jgi:ADP-ribose pyrophosphatase YjhB (NUDIX family)
MSDIHVPGVSINSVLFSYQNGQLNVLLLKFAGTESFMLPGGYIKKEEDIDDAALRILRERTGLENIYLEQFYIAGKASRSADNVVKMTIQERGISNIDDWLNQRKIAACYYALVDKSKIQPKVTERFISEFNWMDVNNLPDLLFDHNEIIEKALERLRLDMDRKLISNNLFKEPFTMPELRALYEAVYQKKFTRSNFQRKMLNLGILERVGKKHEGQANKAPYLYRFKKSKLDKIFD